MSCPIMFVSKKGNNSEGQIQNTEQPPFNDAWYNDIPGITMYIQKSRKSYSKMYGTETR